MFVQLPGLSEKTRVSVPSKSFPPLTADGSRCRASRLAKAGRAGRRSLEPRRFGRRHRGEGGPDGRAASPGNPQLAPQGLEKVGSAPGEPQDLVLGAARPSPRTIPVASRQMTEAKHVSATPPLASRSETAPQKLEMIKSAPGMASNKSKPQDLARGGTAAVGVAATAFRWPRPNLGSRVV